MDFLNRALLVSYLRYRFDKNIHSTRRAGVVSGASTSNNSQFEIRKINLEAYKIGLIDMDALKSKIEKIRSEEAKLNQEKAKIETELRKAKVVGMNEAKPVTFVKVYLLSCMG